MGMTVVEVIVKKTRETKPARKVQFLVDSGAVYSVVDGKILHALGCKPSRRKTFYLADGTPLERRIGDAYFEYKGIGGPAPVIFGEKGIVTFLELRRWKRWNSSSIRSGVSCGQ